MDLFLGILATLDGTPVHHMAPSTHTFPHLTQTEPKLELKTRAAEAVWWYRYPLYQYAAHIKYYVQETRFLETWLFLEAMRFLFAVAI